MFVTCCVEGHSKRSNIESNPIENPRALSKSWKLMGVCDARSTIMPPYKARLKNSPLIRRAGDSYEVSTMDNLNHAILHHYIDVGGDVVKQSKLTQ